ncbi:hypothetical protein L227DRAFT_285475 [Lentinus tigrinus ALCF2SS1-6]|uniref:Uncharacterized protein n=1 Tax=Lentinus tigrinus ALCF2SS1-6 TaxID=1328759 RepID=A0A5C2RYE5_9APHY|nr:hypothetical protein L227DRAFT_285475 [Lentinus tigrinus ALCF2SS1-6]
MRPKKVKAQARRGGNGDVGLHSRSARLPMLVLSVHTLTIFLSRQILVLLVAFQDCDCMYRVVAVVAFDLLSLRQGSSTTQ